jgi:multidrug efflux pump subunit AcrA (membrane-fusion protein)
VISFRQYLISEGLPDWAPAAAVLAPAAAVLAHRVVTAFRSENPYTRQARLDKEKRNAEIQAKRKATREANKARQTIREKLEATSDTHEWVHDFVHSKDPRFRGKSKNKRIQMALAAHYHAKKKASARKGKETQTLRKLFHQPPGPRHKIAGE